MKIVLPVISALLAGILVYFYMQQHPKAPADTGVSNELTFCSQEVSKRLHEMAEDIDTRLSAFAMEVAADQLFSLRLLAENNRTAPEIMGMAGRFIRPMGFSVLTILDSASTILSSGDFPASAGNSALAKAASLSNEPKVIADQIMGKNVLTLQAKKEIRIVDNIRLYAMGGIAIDDDFLARLSPRKGVVVIVKQGTVITGMPGVRTISEIKDNKIVINDKEYGAFSIGLPLAVADAETAGRPELIAVVQPIPADGSSGHK